MQPGPVEEVFIATILREILKGLDYLHSEGKLHRDVKGSELLLLASSSSSVCVITDVHLHLIVLS